MEWSDEDVRKLLRRPLAVMLMHRTIEPDEDDLRYRCHDCKWTASPSISDYERGITHTAAALNEILEPEAPVCEHEWVDVDTRDVKGRYCKKCGGIASLGSDEVLFDSTPYKQLWERV